MQINIYSDESGVFDKNNKHFVFGVLLFSNSNTYQSCMRNFINLESLLKNKHQINNELKGSMLNYEEKKRLVKMINKYAHILIIRIKIDEIKQEILNDKKTRQRYLDYAFKIGLKKHLLYLNKKQQLDLKTIDNIMIFQDQHTTATNGIYELRESILQEFKYGSFNYSWDTYFEPITSNLKNIFLKFCDSKKIPSN